MALIAEYEQRSVADHQFFVRLRAAPVDLQTIWILMANLHASISFHFVSWLAFTVSRVKQHEIAALLVKQLSDELGNGDVQMIHSKLLQRFVDALEAWRPANVSDKTFLPARRLSNFGNRIFFREHLSRALGALMVGEIFAKKNGYLSRR